MQPRITQATMKIFILKELLLALYRGCYLKISSWIHVLREVLCSSFYVILVVCVCEKSLFPIV